MKKLLSLLSVLTISGTAVQTTIAASPYQKETTNLENSEINNLKNLNRNKRQLNKQKFFQTNINLEFSDNPVLFFNNLNLIVRELGRNDILEQISVSNYYNFFENNNYIYHGDVDILFSTNPNSPHNYFSINVNIEGKILILFYRSSDLYLQGFITGSTYNYFNDSQLTNPDIENINTQILPFSGSYQELNNRNNYNWETITSDFENLANPDSSQSVIRQSVIGVILATSESIRFRNIRNILVSSSGYFYLNEYNTIANENQNTATWEDINAIITNWNTETQRAINYFSQNQNDENLFVNYFNQAIVIMTFTNAMFNTLPRCGQLQRSWNNKICYTNNPPCKYIDTTYFLNKNK